MTWGSQTYQIWPLRGSITSFWHLKDLGHLLHNSALYRIKTGPHSFDNMVWVVHESGDKCRFAFCRALQQLHVTARFSIEFNWGNFQPYNSYLSHRWRTFPYISMNFYEKRIWVNLVKMSATLEIIVLFKAKVGAKLRVFGRPRSFQIWLHSTGGVWICRTGFLNQVNRPSKCNSRAVQNWESEHKT